jgi:hypothetical protein
MSQSHILPAEDLRTQIENAKKEIKEAEDNLKYLRRQCKDHKFVELNEKDIEALRTKPWKVSYKKSSAVCSICDEDFGWRCPDSPDGACHYYTGEGKDGDNRRVVILSNKTYYYMDESYSLEDSYDETDDCCLFCGFPEERK